MKRNRRVFFRHPSSLPIHFHTGRRDMRHPSTLKDVGLGGICFSSPIRIRPGTYLELEIPALDELHRFFVRTLWCTQVDEGYEVGVLFQNMDDAFRGRIVEQACYIEAYRREISRKEGRCVSPDRAAQEWIPRFAAEFPGQ